jgi:ribonuclease P protein subunit POP4
MNVTPDIIQAEFIGAEVKITESRHSAYVGMSGRVVDETRNTFTILSHGKRKVIPKDTSTFGFKSVDSAIVEIEGKILVGRPEDRLKKRIRRLW